MRCETLEYLMEEYVQDLLTVEERQIVENHLARCSSCSSLAQQYKDLTADLIDSFSAIEIPDTLDQVVEAKVNSMYKKQRTQYRWQKVLAIAASFVVIMFSALQLPSVSQLIYGNQPGLANIEPDITAKAGQGQELVQTLNGITMEIDNVRLDSNSILVIYKISSDMPWDVSESAVRLHDLRIWGPERTMAETGDLNDYGLELSHQASDDGLIGTLIIKRTDLGDKLFLSTEVVLDYAGGSEADSATFFSPRFEFELEIPSP